MAAAKKTSTPLTGTVNVLGTDWKVVLRPFEAMADGEKSDLFGYCCGTSFEIHINELKAPASYADTLQHELLHAFEAMLGISVEEETVRLLATSLRAFFKANPKLAKWLVA